MSLGILLRRHDLIRNKPGLIAVAPSTPITNLKAAWGTVLRVSGYVGPAITVEDYAGVGPDVDLYFDANGYVTDAPPYADTRVKKIWSQRGDGNHLIAPVHASNYANPPYVPADGVYKTARIGGSGNYNGFQDVKGRGNSTTHAYVCGNPIMCISAEFGASGGFRTLGGVRGSTSGFTNWWYYGGWQDNTYDGRILWQIERQTSVAYGSTTPYVLPGEQMRYTFSHGSSPAYHYLNTSQLGAQGWTSPITYPYNSMYFLGGIPYNVNNYLVNAARVGFIEVFIQDTPTASVTTKEALDALMLEAKV